MEKSSQSILIVDDVVQNVELLLCLFQGTGFRLITAKTGEEAIDKMHYHHPDLVLLDIQMPGLNGIEVLKIAKRTDSIQEIPIFMISACCEAEYRTESFDQGAIAYFTKPINFQEIMNEISKVIRISSNYVFKPQD